MDNFTTTCHVCDKQYQCSDGDIVCSTACAIEIDMWERQEAYELEEEYELNAR